MCTNMAGRYSQITCVCVHHMVEWHIWHICKNVIKTYVRHVSWSHVHPGWKSDQIKATPNTLITLRTPGAKMPPDHTWSSDHNTCTRGKNVIRPNMYMCSDTIPTMNSKGGFGKNEWRATSITNFAGCSSLPWWWWWWWSSWWWWWRWWWYHHDDILTS